MKDKIINIISAILVAVLLIVFTITGIKILKRDGKINTENNVGIAEPESSTYSNESTSTVAKDESSKTETVYSQPEALPEPSEIPSEAETSEADKNESKANAKFTDAPKGYFNDALFIGDSRTVGLMEYAAIDGADYFATTGMSIYNIYKEKVPVAKIGNITFDSLMKKRKYGKIYVMLGINELGYNMENSAERYEGLIKKLKSCQPDAVIFIGANLHVSESRSASDKIYNNSNINKYNKKISQFADNKTVFYIDVNVLFDDDNGNLASEYTYDNTHVLGKYYQAWSKWITTKAIVK